MKKLVLILVLLLAVQTWGVYGAARTKGLGYDCTLEVGPLCFLWEETALHKLVGDDRLDEIEEAVEEARDKWEKEVVEKVVDGKNGVEKVLDEIGDMAKDGAENAKKILDEKVK